MNFHMSPHSASLGADIERELEDRLFPSDLSLFLGGTQRILLETKMLSLVASLSPVTWGHCIAFSRVPAPSFCALKIANQAIAAEITEVRDRYESVFGPAFRFEHGMSFEKDSTACGVTRAHFHLIPRNEIDFKALERRLWEELGDPTVVGSAWPDKFIRHQEYLWIEGFPPDTFTWLNKRIPSQIVRRHIAAQHGLEEWDWKQLFGWPNMRRTIDTWKASEYDTPI